MSAVVFVSHIHYSPKTVTAEGRLNVQQTQYSKASLLVTAYIRGISEKTNNSRCQSQNTCRCCFVEQIMFAMDLLRHARTVSVRIHRGVFGCEGLGGVQMEKFNHLEVLLSGGQGGVSD